MRKRVSGDAAVGETALPMKGRVSAVRGAEKVDLSMKKRVFKTYDVEKEKLSMHFYYCISSIIRVMPDEALVAIFNALTSSFF